MGSARKGNEGEEASRAGCTKTTVRAAPAPKSEQEAAGKRASGWYKLLTVTALHVHPHKSSMCARVIALDVHDFKLEIYIQHPSHKTTNLSRQIAVRFCFVSLHSIIQTKLEIINGIGM